MVSLLGPSSLRAHPGASAKSLCNAVRSVTMTHGIHLHMLSTPRPVSFTLHYSLFDASCPRLAYQPIPCTGTTSSYLTSSDCSCVRLRNRQALNPHTSSTLKAGSKRIALARQADRTCPASGSCIESPGSFGKAVQAGPARQAGRAGRAGPKRGRQEASGSRLPASGSRMPGKGILH
jgi:hypothetical protein